MILRCAALVLLATLPIKLFAADAAPTAESIEFFEKKIRPILAEKCFSCHGAEKQKGHLRMDSRAAILKGGEGGPAAVPGKPAASLMIQAVRYQGDTQMPPKAKLPDDVAAALEKWVTMEMPWPGDVAQVAETKKAFQITDEQRAFWAFQPVKVQKVPDVKDAAWAKTEIDRFILAKLEEKNLKPVAPAEKRTLIRRATFDLTGLPPTPEEVNAFLNDNAPDAFAKVVDRLLASPRYGEHWGRHWLDVVRYADSRDSRGSGSEGDIANSWRYRDWVVNAFNTDLPYDKFVINQIAGDLLPPAKPDGINADGLIATTLLSIGEWGTGDADKDKMMTDIVDDQIDVVSRPFMALTMACARCHDHKFDPISNQDYYAMAGIFFSTHIIANPGKKTDGTPNMNTPLIPKAEADRLTQQSARAPELEKALKAELDGAFNNLSKTLLPQTEKYLSAAFEYVKAGETQKLPEFAASKGLQEFILQQWVNSLQKRSLRQAAYPLMKRNAKDISGNPGVYQWRGEPDCPNLMINTNDNSVQLGTLKLPPKSVSVHPGPKAGVAISWKSPITGEIKIAGKVIDADNVCGDGIAWVIEHQSAKGVSDLATGEITNGGNQAFTAPALNSLHVTEGDLVNVLVLPKGEYTCDMTTVEWTLETLDGKLAWKLPGDLVAEPLQGNPHSDTHGHADVWSFGDMAGVNRVSKGPAELEKLVQRAIDAAEGAARTAEIKKIQEEINAAKPDAAIIKMFNSPGSPYISGNRDEKILPKETQEKLANLRKEWEEAKKVPAAAIPKALAAQDGGVPTSIYEGVKDTHLLIRGSYKRPGEIVPRRFPTILAGDKQVPLGERTKQSGRLELAQWIASPTHPLTARVMANRIWQFHFGEGLVRTPSNFGKLGERPTHPELLDYLATKFVESGWSVKAMHRAIMLSSAYQVSGKASKEHLAAHPDNHLFGRMSRHRAEAEVLRDSLLFAADALNFTMGGLPDRDPLTSRRMLYLVSIRSDRSSFGPLFDGADSTAQVPKRTVSTVSPQALYMLDNDFINKQAAALAKNLLGEKLDDAGRIEKAYQKLYARPPREAELKIGLGYLQAAREAKRPDDKAWAEYAQILLCANEFVFVD